MPKYKHGKEENPLSFREFKNKVEKATLSTEKVAFIWLLFWAGCRKSEAYERTTKDCQVTNTYFIIDFGQRKKHGTKVPPLRFPRSWAGIEQLIKLHERASSKRPHNKRVFYQENKTTKSKVIKDQWLFPHIQSSTALRLVKEVLGSKYYPHFLRLNRLTEIGTDPTANVTRMKSYSGIKSIKALESYLGTSKEEQEAALSWMKKRMK
ncbi:MAG: hypothetical protein ACFFCD_16605 [Promethearchaeota archaeon]